MEVSDSLTVAPREKSGTKRQLAEIVTVMHSEGIPYEIAVREFKKSYLTAVLTQTRGHLGKTSHQLGIHHNTLTRLLAELDMQPRKISAVRVAQ